MTLHLIKLCVGVDTVQELRDWHEKKIAQRKRMNPPRLWHVTRMMPKRREEILDGGSLYWVIKGFVQVRQPIAALEAITDEDGLACCRIRLEERLVLVALTPHRPFQGWRYLPTSDAPADLRAGQRQDALPPALLKELSDLGLA